MCLAAYSEEFLSCPWWLYMCGKWCTETVHSPLTPAATAPTRTQFWNSPKHVFQRCPFFFLPLTLKKLSFWACFCRFYVKLLFPQILCSGLCSWPLPSCLAAVITFDPKVLCGKPVMSFCPRGSHDEVEAGCHPELCNSCQWGIQSALGYW